MRTILGSVAVIDGTGPSPPHRTTVMVADHRMSALAAARPPTPVTPRR